MKILVVDDEALLVKGIRFNLQNEGYDVITGSDGLDAVRLVQEQSPDLLVLDVMMPNMDGLTACSKIREFSDIPIILLTAKVDAQIPGRRAKIPAGQYSDHWFHHTGLRCSECLPQRPAGRSDCQGIRCGGIPHAQSQPGLFPGSVAGHHLGL